MNKYADIIDIIDAFDGAGTGKIDLPLVKQVHDFQRSMKVERNGSVISMNREMYLFLAYFYGSEAERASIRAALNEQTREAITNLYYRLNEALEASARKPESKTQKFINVIFSR